MTTLQQAITLIIIIVVTIFTRAVAFLIFPEGKKTPPFILYLGKALPPAVFGMLVIYCLKDVSIFSKTHAIPELVSILIVAILHIWKKNMFISIAAGTTVYMILINFVFV